MSIYRVWKSVFLISFLVDSLQENIPACQYLLQIEYTRNTVTPSLFALGQREDEKERRKSNLIFKYNQPITKLQQGSRFVTNRENGVCVNKYMIPIQARELLTSHKRNYFHYYKSHPKCVAPSCTVTVSSNCATCWWKRGKSTIYRTYTRQMLVSSAIDLCKWHMSYTEGTIRMSRHHWHSYKRSWGCHFHPQWTLTTSYRSGTTGQLNWHP